MVGKIRSRAVRCAVAVVIGVGLAASAEPADAKSKERSAAAMRSWPKWSKPSPAKPVAKRPAAPSGAQSAKR